MSISINSTKFNSRTNEIRRLLLPLSKNCNSISARVATSQKGSIVLSVFSGTSPTSSNHKDWFFKTNNEYYKGSYFEVWLEQENCYILEKAYFKLMLIEDYNYIEILSLHIDPSVKDNKYKSGPHIHVITSVDKISKAHLSLNLNDISLVLSSYDKFKEAYKNALNMINDEIILK